MTRLMSVLFPDPLDPTSAVVEPAGAWKVTCWSTGTPAVYSNETSVNSISPSIGPSGSRERSSSPSVDICISSRMRSRPANASLICVPMEEIWITGAAMSPVKKM